MNKWAITFNIEGFVLIVLAIMRVVPLGWVIAFSIIGTALFLGGIMIAWQSSKANKPFLAPDEASKLESIQKENF